MPLLPRFEAARQKLEDEAKIEKLVQESGDSLRTVARATLAGDSRRMRGIPVVGRGIGGTSPHTHPLGRRTVDGRNAVHTPCTHHSSSGVLSRTQIWLN